MDTLEESVAKGDMNQGGLILLDIIPKVNAAGTVILRIFGVAANKERNLEMKNVMGSRSNGESGDSSGTSNVSKKTTDLDMKAYRIEYALNEVLGYLGETDVMIGQGLRGQLGVSAPAQLQILSNLGDAKMEFDELLRAVPEKM